ncbi:hypothetical protein MAPG_10706 [Magnaporthiopsis poae ATCC 64411]|uniref:Uncharacterized protein n=1 Tax=Magnaporthiopsis poae (strain ATCC 64411 / 73-15) TaxID=644358 RepID=A0A0C4EDB1_MAGP6|nr:hypothetical protein MAPG_10706 [Magnaporthiopsis poae ATCC 64411]
MADPVKWWEANRPNSMAAITWDQKRSWVDWAQETRGEAHTFLAEGTGHGNFKSYHERFNHPWDPRQDCVCGLPREVGHTNDCEVRKIPARWSRQPPPVPSRAEAEWLQRGRNAVVRTRLEAALKKIGAKQLIFAARDGVEVVGVPQAGAPGDLNIEEELPVAGPGRLD